MTTRYLRLPVSVLTLFAIAVALSCPSAMAQVRIVGAISGTVIDPAGAGIPGAKVVLKDEGTGIGREATTASNGSFSFPDLAHGQYSVTVIAAGFQHTVVAHISVVASQTTDVPVNMKIGQQTETVTVEGTAPILEVTSNLVSDTKTTKLVNELPTGSRSPG